jgi:N-formylglutamate deformylase
MILHIPHSSKVIPISKGFIQNPQVIQKELQLLTDWFTDELFDLPRHAKIVTTFSRIFCDVERFEDDELEEMSKFGMGVLYEKTDSGEILRLVNKDLREQILVNYYRPHHKAFTSLVRDDLDQYGKRSKNIK